jgi:hypothetical protein
MVYTTNKAVTIVIENLDLILEGKGAAPAGRIAGA